MPARLERLADIARRLAEAEVDATLRRDDGAGWEAVWSALPYQGVAAAAPMIDYQHAYFRGAGWTLLDASLVLRNDGRPCGVWPLTVGGPDGQPRLTSAGAAVSAPQFVTGLSVRTVKKLCGRLLDLLAGLAQAIGQTTPIVLEQAAEPGRGADGANEWHQRLLASGASPVVRHDLYTDLQPDLTAIRASFRKSFRPLINAGLRSWSVFVLAAANADSAVWDEFRQLHFAVAGRVTRSAESWDLQFAQLRAGQAFLVGLRDPASQRLVGAGFFQVTRDEGLYAVGAYDRGLFDKPLGHVVQQRAIEVMKALGLRWYRIGERHFPQDQPPPTDKQVAIAAFKQGFASHLYCRHEFSWNPAPVAAGAEPS
jgi:FemAB family protein